MIKYFKIFKFVFMIAFASSAGWELGADLALIFCQKRVECWLLSAFGQHCPVFASFKTIGESA
jgi:hypothetical protein